MENIVETKENVETTLDQADETPQETYHVLEFIKEHTSSFLAILSGIVAVAAFVLNLAAYVYQRAKLNPWNISGEVIEFWGNRQFLLTFALELAYISLVYAVPIMLSRFFVRYYRLTATLRYWKARIKAYRKIHKQAHRDIKALKKRLTKFETEENEELSVQIQKVETSLAEIKRGLSKERKNCWLACGLTLACIGIICFFSMLLFVPVIILMSGVTGEISWRVLLAFWGSATLLVVLPAQIRAKQMDKEYAPKAVRQSIKEILSSNDASQRLRQKMKEAFEKAKERMTVIKTLTDNTIKEFGFKTLLGTCIMMLFLCVSATDITYKQKDFWIYSDSAQTYVVAYQDGSHCVLSRLL